MTECEDCGDEVKRRTKCANCWLKVCGWCKHHVHDLHARIRATQRNNDEGKA